MNKICTSLEQSMKLIELGIDVNTADMCYINGKANIGFLSEEYKMFGDNVLTDYWPAWSLTALLGLIPPGNILLRDVLSGKYKCINTVDSCYYDNPLDAIFEMVVCLLSKNVLI